LAVQVRPALFVSNIIDLYQAVALDSSNRDSGLSQTAQFERDTLQGNVVSTFQAGTFFGMGIRLKASWKRLISLGALLTFSLGERLGRKRAILFASLIFLIGGTLMTAANGKIGMIIAGRAIAGLGIGSVSLVVPVYIAETSPPSIRGRLVGIFEIPSSECPLPDITYAAKIRLRGGGMCGFWVSYAVNQTISKSTKTQWIVPFGLQLPPGILLFLGFMWCPEWPHWYAKQGNWEKATETLS